jgi:broad specificity phosphatase PhoE
VGNVGPLRQTATTPLSEKGRNQASLLAKRCANLPIEVIVSSTMNRARETSSIILERIEKKVEYSDLFIERRRPSEVLGIPKDAPTALLAEQETRNNFSKSGWRFSDEENFDDLRERAFKALSYLKNRSEDNILVVTHGYFLRVIVACVVFGENITAKECERFIGAFQMENTGITLIGYDHYNEDGPWRLVVWNDHAHLG